MKITSVKTNVEGMEDIIPVLMPLDEIGSGDACLYKWYGRCRDPVYDTGGRYLASIIDISGK